MQDPSPTSLWREKWNTALNESQKPYVGTVDTAAQSIPPTYTKVSLAGFGLFGHVYFCLPTDTVSFARRSVTSGTTTTQQSAHSLTSKLVVVKVAGRLYKTTLVPELRALRAIHAQQQCNDVVEKCFFQLIEWDTVGEFPQWMVTSALPVCCNLDELSGYYGKMPEAFTWLVYTQVHSALQFLHKTCTPAIAHIDLHKGNVVIGFSDPDAKERGLMLPQVKIIDFGNAAFYPEEEMSGTLYSSMFHTDMLGRDTEAFLQILDDVVHTESGGFDQSDPDMSDAQKWRYIERKPPAGRTAEFYDFDKALCAGLARGMLVGPVVLVEMWKAFGSFAEQSLAKIDKADLEQIWNVVLGVAESRFEETREGIEELLA